MFFSNANQVYVDPATYIKRKITQKEVFSNVFRQCELLELNGYS